MIYPPFLKLSSESPSTKFINVFIPLALFAFGHNDEDAVNRHALGNNVDLPN